MVSRQALLIGWIGITGLTFISALGFKSGAIEEDVRTRVLENLESNAMSVPELDVNGRHVRMSGFVPTESHKEMSLELADDTYGALGPRDGLNVFSASGGYFYAIKSEDNITLRGNVASEAARAELVDLASTGSATVTDELKIFNAGEPWNADVSSGLKDRRTRRLGG